MLTDYASAISVLNQLAAEAHGTALEKGWYEGERGIPELLCLIHSELSECLEAARHNNPVSDKIPPHRQCVEELADVLIRTLDMAAYQGWDIGRAVSAKLVYNTTRPLRHGGKAY